MSAIYLPNGQDALVKAPPQYSAVEVATPDGKTLAFPQVAVAMMIPDVINLIAEAVYQRLVTGNLINENAQFVPSSEETTQ